MLDSNIEKIKDRIKNPSQSYIIHSEEDLKEYIRKPKEAENA